MVAPSRDMKEIEKSLQPGAGVTRIGPSIHIKGEIVSKDNFLLEGTLEGNLKAEAMVYVGPGGKVIGDIQANNVVVDGEIQGNIEASDRIELRASGKVVGDIRTVRVKIAEGSHLAGNLTVKGRPDGGGDRPGRLGT